jgi:hypothetical protein
MMALRRGGTDHVPAKLDVSEQLACPAQLAQSAAQGQVGRVELIF